MPQARSVSHLPIALEAQLSQSNGSTPASAVFAAFYVRFEVRAEKSDFQLHWPRLRALKGGGDVAVAANRDAQFPGFSRTHRKHPIVEPAFPFLTVHNEVWCVNGIDPPGRGVAALSICKLRARETIRPAKAVPVIDVKGNGDHAFPQMGLIFY